jgi:hypothetical protein
MSILPGTVADWAILVLAFSSGAAFAYLTTGVGPYLVPFTCGLIVGCFAVGMLGGLLVWALLPVAYGGGSDTTTSYGFFGGLAGAAIGAIAGWWHQRLPPTSRR